MTIQVHFEGMTVQHVLDDMRQFIAAAEAGSTKTAVVEIIPEKASKPAKSRTAKTAEVPTETVVEPTGTTANPAADHAAALDLLRLAFAAGRADEVNAIAKAFGVKKLGQVPTEKGTELLTAAQAL